MSDKNDRMTIKWKMRQSISSATERRERPSIKELQRRQSLLKLISILAGQSWVIILAPDKHQD